MQTMAKYENLYSLSVDLVPRKYVGQCQCQRPAWNRVSFVVEESPCDGTMQGFDSIYLFVLVCRRPVSSLTHPNWSHW